MLNTNTAAHHWCCHISGLRRAIGILGVGLPSLLVFGKLALQGPGIEPSISDYYYTIMGDVFLWHSLSIVSF